MPVAKAEPENRGVGIYLDQDFLVPVSNEDRDYTMGFAAEFFWGKAKGLYPLDNLVAMAGKWLGIDDKDNNLVYSFMLGTVAFTPDNLSDTAAIYDDRPYASLIYLSNKRVRADYKNAVAAEVRLGVLGTRFTEYWQTRFHTTYRSLADDDEPVDPLGWSHQISDGGELTMLLRLTNSRLKQGLSSPGDYDVATTWGASLGYQTNLHVGAAFRAGSIKSPFWSLPYDPVNRGSFLPKRSKNEWYFWAAFRAHAVIYDVLLQGQFRDSDVTYAADEIERFVYDAATGLTLGFDDSQLTFSTNAKSADLKAMDRNQIWGSVNYIYHF
ncbi:MAG: lipid A deacylase LpxR family protein [Gammaproteobacteria bacterium]|nr:lipid A deacylase LpxR family protein [Gammaproteobacteria bacterium]